MHGFGYIKYQKKRRQLWLVSQYGGLKARHQTEIFLGSKNSEKNTI